MKEDHNIDRLFQESFKDFEVSPPKHLWGNIEKELKSDSRKRAIPIWLRLTGVAALIAVVLLVGSQWFIPSDKLKPTLPIVNKVINPKETKIIPQKESVAIPELASGIVSNTEEEHSANETKDQILNADSNLLSTFSTPLLNPKSSKNALAVAGRKELKQQQNLDKLPIVGYSERSGGQIVIISNPIIKSPQGIRISTLDLHTQSTISRKVSLVQVANQIADNQTEEAFVEETSTKPSWYVKPQVSPIFYGNLADGSSIDSGFSENSSQGNVDVSYGLNVGYQLNKKFKIRTGINSVNVSYSTNNVFLLPNTEISALNNVSVSDGFYSSVVTAEQLNTLAENNQFGRQEAINSELRQDIGFIEFPVEVEYTLVDKKIGVHVIGGASTFLLNDNNLDVINLQGTSSLGEANNINNLSFSTNFALGFDYSLSKNLFLNLEPTFKYQINTFQSGTTDFQPYFIAVYSGMTFKF